MSRLVKPHLDDVLVPESTSTDSPTHEFVSDTFRASSSDLEEVREGMKKLGMDPAKRNGKFYVKSSIIHSDRKLICSVILGQLKSLRAGVFLGIWLYFEACGLDSFHPRFCRSTVNNLLSGFQASKILMHSEKTVNEFYNSSGFI